MDDQFPKDGNSAKDDFEVSPESGGLAAANFRAKPAEEFLGGGGPKPAEQPNQSEKIQTPNVQISTKSTESDQHAGQTEGILGKSLEDYLEKDPTNWVNDRIVSQQNDLVIEVATETASKGEFPNLHKKGWKGKAVAINFAQSERELDGVKLVRGDGMSYELINNTVAEAGAKKPVYVANDAIGVMLEGRSILLDGKRPVSAMSTPDHEMLAKKIASIWADNMARMKINDFILTESVKPENVTRLSRVSQDVFEHFISELRKQGFETHAQKFADYLEYDRPTHLLTAKKIPNAVLPPLTDEEEFVLKHVIKDPEIKTTYQFLEFEGVAKISGTSREYVYIDPSFRRLNADKIHNAGEQLKNLRQQGQSDAQIQDRLSTMISLDEFTAMASAA